LYTPPAPPESQNNMVAHAQITETSDEEAYVAVAKFVAELRDGEVRGPPCPRMWAPGGP
jgi:hypothetical protein